MEERNASGIHIEVWERKFFLRVDSFTYTEKHKPAKRPAISIVIALNQPFKITQKAGAAAAFCHSMIIGPQVLRDHFDARESDLWVFDVAINTPEYHDLLSFVQIGQIRELNTQQHESIARLCRAHTWGTPAKELLESVVYCLCEPGCANRFDKRINEVLSLIEKTPSDELSVRSLAASVGLSESRLRGLFTQQLHINLARYIRFSGYWKALLQIEQGKNFTEAAHLAGFHDLSHFNRAVAEFSGFSPSVVLALFGTHAMHHERKIIKR